MWSLSSWGSEETRNRSSSCVTLLVREPGAQDRHHTSLWMTTFRSVTACPSGTCRRSTMPWVHKDEFQRFPPTWRASVNVWSSDIWSRIGGNASRRDQSHVNTRHEGLDWFGPSHRVIALHLVLMYYAIEIGSSLFISGSFRVFFEVVFWLSLMWIYPLYL
jgi:hypothetical protein